MLDLRSYCADPSESRGWRRIVVPFRRLLHFLLQPIFQRQAELFQHLSSELDRLAERLDELERLAEGAPRRS